MSNNLSFDVFETEYNAFIKCFVEYQNIEFKCNDCSSKTEQNVRNIITVKDKGETNLSFNRSTLCEKCLVISDSKFTSIPAFILVEIDHYNEIDNKILISDIPLCFSFNNVTFKFLFATIFNESSEHYRAIFRLNNSFYLVDDLSKSLKKIPINYELCSVFYYLH